MDKCQQLWSYADGNCLIPEHIAGDNELIKRSCKNAPVMHWPDGTVSWSVTHWLLTKYKGLSSKSARGSSSGTYSSQISHLVRFVYNKRISFSDLNDDHFYEWAEILRNEKHPNSIIFKRRRNNTQIGKIMRRAIDFLQWYQNNLFINWVIIGTGADGSQIKVTLKKGSHGGYSFSYWDHQSIPKDDVPQDVKPISHSVITELYDAIPKLTKIPYIRKRLYQLLRLLESTGGRRIEISEIKTDDIEQALLTGRLLLRVAKQKRDKYREVPLAREWIDPIIVFIETHRKKLVNRLIKQGKLNSDPGFLFLSEITGLPLCEQTITKEISQLRILAGVDEKACGHMFRHRFITLQIIYRLKEYIGKELPMDIAHVILTKVASITGHKGIKGLLPYFDLAFQEMGVWDTPEKVLMMRSKADAAFRNVQILIHDIKEKKCSNNELLNSVSELLKNVINDLNEIQTNEQGMLSI